MKTTTPWPLLGGLRFVLAGIVVAELGDVSYPLYLLHIPVLILISLFTL